MFDIKQYVRNAFYIFKTNTIIIWFVILLGVVSSLNERFSENSFHDPIAILCVMVSFIALPVIYGIYYELIEDRYSSIGEIGKKYIFPYVWLIINMYMPVLLFIFFASLLVPELGGPGSWRIILVSFELLFLYVLPVFYVSGTWRGAILVGVQFLIKNLSASTSILMWALFAELVFIYLQQALKKLTDLNTVLYVTLNTGIFLTEVMVYCVIFMVLVFLLKDAKGREEIDS